MYVVHEVTLVKANSKVTSDEKNKERALENGALLIGTQFTIVLQFSIQF
jgi:hypothetical protein